jgi:3-oxoacyl-[acyl-carrier-protein] synthase-3
LTVEDLRMVIPHQANLRILQATQEAMGLPREKLYINLDRYGNTASASVPIALSEFMASQVSRPGDNLLLAAFGGGLTWASALVRCADVPGIQSRRQHRTNRARISIPVHSGTTSRVA